MTQSVVKNLLIVICALGATYVLGSEFKEYLDQPTVIFDGISGKPVSIETPTGITVVKPGDTLPEKYEKEVR
jgi:hypothetical protein